jgi:hypothetical protein
LEKQFSGQFCRLSEIFSLMPHAAFVPAALSVCALPPRFTFITPYKGKNLRYAVFKGQKLPAACRLFLPEQGEQLVFCWTIQAPMGN